MANNVDIDQTAHDLGLHCLLIRLSVQISSIIMLRVFIQ